jgi:hypothetical protein
MTPLSHRLLQDEPEPLTELLARLERLGLIENAGEGHSKGEPNAWALTAMGQRVAQGIRGVPVNRAMSDLRRQ